MSSSEEDNVLATLDGDGDAAAHANGAADGPAGALGVEELGDSEEDNPDDYDDSDEDDEDGNDDDEEDAGLRRKMSELRGMMGSFFPFQTPNSFNTLDIILTKDDFDLEQLLDLDDFLADLRRTKPKLIEYLQRPAVFRKLVEYISAEKYPEHLELERAKRYAHLAYEAIQTEPLKEVMINDSTLLDRFFSFLDITTEMDPLRCAYFSRIVEILFERYPKELINYMKQKKDMVGKFVWHINNQYIVESLFRLIDSSASHAWLHEEDLIPLLMIKLGEAEDSELQDKTSQAFVEILDLFVPFPYSVLTTQMFHAPIVAEQWEQFTFADMKDHKRVLNGLSVAIGILSLSFEGNMADETPIFMKRVIAKLDVFLDLLKTPPQVEEPFKMTYGDLDPPFGFLRLKVLEFLSALLNTKYPMVLKSLLRADIFEVLINLFFSFKWNNTMHFYIQHILVNMLQCENDSQGERITSIVFVECKFVDHVARAFEKESDRTVGYIGHLVGICNEILRIAPDYSHLKDFLAASEPWKNLCNGSLKEAIERHKPLVERPTPGPDDYSGPMSTGEYSLGMQGDEDNIIA